MDLLSDGSSCCSEDIDIGIKRDPAKNEESERGEESPISSAAVASISSVPKLHGNKRKRGSVVILPSDEAPVDSFQRAVPHKRGHWAGHVLVPVMMTNSFHDNDDGGDGVSAAMEKSIVKFQRALEREGYSGTIFRHGAPRLHLSLSKFFSLQLAFIDSFVDKLAERIIKSERATRLFVDRRKAQILVNDDKTRSFLIWKVQANGSLLRIVKHVDSVLADYDKPLYYDPPIFHISICSFAGNLQDLDLTRIDPDDGHSHSSSSEESNGDEEEPSFLVVDKLVCRFGTTKSYTIPLMAVS